jgi:hypothetical protein
MPIVKYRCYEPGLRPRQTRLEVPGWGGEREPRADGSRDYAWHCLPFTEGAQYGLELFYPYNHELRVSARDGIPQFHGDFGEPPAPGVMWPPFRNFGDIYYTYQLSLDLNPGPGMAVRFETHPRFYTDTTNTVPVAVPALIRNWWPMTFFLVFKTPVEGQTHIFRGGEPFVQAMVIPEECKLTFEEMNAEEAAQRELQSRRIYKSRNTLAAESQWTSASNTVFDGTYRRILGAAKSKSRRAPTE